jgi:hypothetical protein
MNKILFALPVCLLFAYCSGSRKVATPPAGPGISNVSVITGQDTVKANSITTTAENRDWAYKANRDTMLKGSWTLQGMTNADGTWSTTDAWYADTAAAATGTTDVSATGTETGTEANATTGTTTTKKATKTSTKKTSKSTLRATRSLQKYDSLMANTTIYSDSALNANIKPYRYWNTIPSVNLNPTALIFTGSTGCNRMSGSFNFSGSDIKFSKNIVTSKMACNEYNEAAFLDLLRRADSFAINNEGLLELRQGGTLLMTFRRSM